MNSMVDLLIQGLVCSSVNIEKMPQEHMPSDATVGLCTPCAISCWVVVFADALPSINAGHGHRSATSKACSILTARGI